MTRRLRIISVRSVRTFRPWHWTPRRYAGVNGVTSALIVWGWWGMELEPQDNQEKAR